jgi:hypothetical protein
VALVSQSATSGRHEHVPQGASMHQQLRTQPIARPMAARAPVILRTAATGSQTHHQELPLSVDTSHDHWRSISCMQSRRIDPPNESLSPLFDDPRSMLRQASPLLNARQTPGAPRFTTSLLEREGHMNTYERLPVHGMSFVRQGSLAPGESHSVQETDVAVETDRIEELRSGNWADQTHPRSAWNATFLQPTRHNQAPSIHGLSPGSDYMGQGPASSGNIGPLALDGSHSTFTLPVQANPWLQNCRCRSLFTRPINN